MKTRINEIKKLQKLAGINENKDWWNTFDDFSEYIKQKAVDRNIIDEDDRDSSVVDDVIDEVFGKYFEKFNKPFGKFTAEELDFALVKFEDKMGDEMLKEGAESLDEISSQDDLSKEIAEYKKNSEEVKKLEASIADTLKKIKDISKGEDTRLKQIINYMQDFKVKQVKADKWVASLEEVAKYSRPQPSYKELWEEALGKLNAKTVDVMKQLEHAQVAEKSKETKPEFKVEPLKENLLDLAKKGMKFVTDKIKGLLTTIKGYKDVVDGLPVIKAINEGWKKPKVSDEKVWQDIKSRIMDKLGYTDEDMDEDGLEDKVNRFTDDFFDKLSDRQIQNYKFGKKLKENQGKKKWLSEKY